MKEHLKNTFLGRWINNDLSKEEELSFRESPEYETLKKIAEVSQKLKTPNYEKTKVFSNLQNKKNTRTKIRSIRSHWIYKVAAIAIILFGVFHLLKPSQTEFTTKIGEQLTFVLPDSTKVTLNSNSSLIFSANNWEENKVVTLDGEAFFSVTHGALFSVKTNTATIKVLGTQFNVTSHGTYFETQCYQGKVKVTASKARDIILSKGKAYRMEGAVGNHLDIVDKNPSWLTGESTFKNVPLEYVLSALKNQFGITLTYSKENYKTARFTGSFIHNDLDTSLQMVFSAMEIDYIKQGNTIILK